MWCFVSYTFSLQSTHLSKTFTRTLFIQRKLRLKYNTWSWSAERNKDLSVEVDETNDGTNC